MSSFQPSTKIHPTKIGLGGFAGIAASASLLFVSAASCSSEDGKTELNPEGPPMVRQLFVFERVASGDNVVQRLGLAFGDHPDVAQEQDDRTVDAAVALPLVAMRLVMDELLVGNQLEEIRCADGTFARVPLDADPNDISDCAPVNLSAGKCTALCAGNMGIADADNDGAPDADAHRMITVEEGKLAVQLSCNGENVPLDSGLSYYVPAGNQQITAGPLGINSLGPALVLLPGAGMRTSADCTIIFDPSVVDKDGIQPCAPPNGDINQACTPGDTTQISFGTEALALSQSEPGQDAVAVPVTTGATADKEISLLFNAIVSADSVAAGFTLIENPGADQVDRTADMTAEIDPNGSDAIRLVVTGGLLGDTVYELVYNTALTDIFGGALPSDTVLSFTTGAAPDIDASIDAAL